MAVATTVAETYVTDIVKVFEHLDLPNDELIIVGGAAMQMLGIKRTTDIDVVVKPETMIDIVASQLEVDDFERRRLGRRYSPRTRKMIFGVEGMPLPDRLLNDDQRDNRKYGVDYRGAVTVMLPPNDELYSASYGELRAEALTIGGLLVSPPERLLAWKQGVNRRKDQADINRLQRHLAQ